MSISINSNTYSSNMYTSNRTTSQSISSSAALNIVSETTTELEETKISLPIDNKENYLGEIQFANGSHAVAYKDKDFSENNPVITLYTKSSSNQDWETMTVNINDVDKSNMSMMEGYAVGTGLIALGKADNLIISHLTSGYNETKNFGYTYSYDDLFEKYDVKTIFEKQMQTQYSCGNIQGYLNFKKCYDALFND